MDTTTTQVTTKPCIGCGETSVVTVNAAALAAWRAGAFIQDAFPYMRPEDREVLMTGTHPACWNALFPEEDEGA